MADILGSILGAVGSLFGAGGNVASTAATNKANKEIAQMNNEWNYRMFQEQQDYNREMWNAQNEYNSAVNQRARLQEAGLNPYAMMSGASAGTAGAANGVNPPSAQPVQLQAPQIDLSTPASFLQQAIELHSVQGQRDADASLKERQAEQIGIENQYKAAELVAELVRKQEETNSFKLRNSYQNILNRLQLDTYSSDVAIKQRTADNIKTLTELNRAEIALKSINTVAMQKQINWIDKEAAARIASLLASANLSNEQAKQAIQNTLESSARTKGIQINNRILSDTAQTIVDRAYYETGVAEGRSTQEQNKAKINRHGEWAGNLGITKLLDTIFGY